MKFWQQRSAKAIGSVIVIILATALAVEAQQALPAAGRSIAAVDGDPVDAFMQSYQRADAAAQSAAPAEDEPATEESEPQTPPTPGESLVEEELPGTFRVSFQNTELSVALRLLSRQGRRNIISGRDVEGIVNATLYDVTFEEALDAILRMNGYVYREEGHFIFIYTPEELAALIQSEQALETRMFRLSYITAQDAEVLIQPSLSESGVVAISPPASVGVASSTVAAGGNDMAINDVIIVRDLTANLDQIERILEELDVRPDQVMIEATILSARLTEDNALGINYNSLVGVDFETMGATSTGVGDMTRGGLEGSDLGVRAAEFTTGFDTVDGGMTIGFLSNSTAFFISALESITDLTVLANPKLLVLNKQRGQVVIGARDGYRTTVVNDGVSTEEVEFLETGTRLFVRPFIAEDGYIRLEIHPEDSDGSIDDSGLPSETTTEVTSNVLVRDGHTIVIGGLFRDEASEVRSQVPIFGNIRGLGVLFRNTTDNVERREVIIVITPHIIRYNADDDASSEIVDAIERFRVGQRRGLRWWGRSRMAAAYTRWALEAWRRGDRDTALWDVDVALSLDPRLLEAIELKEEITQTSYTVDAVRVSAVEGVVQQLILDDLQRGTPATPSGTTSDGVETVTIGIRPVGGVGSTEEEEQSQGAAAEDANASALPAESTLPDEVVFPSR
jgi:type IV pilus assembly protein PilQ